MAFQSQLGVWVSEGGRGEGGQRWGWNSGECGHLRREEVYEEEVACQENDEGMGYVSNMVAVFQLT